MASAKFDEAITFLSDYRKDHGKALNNEQSQKWSTYPVSTISEYIQKFDSKEENDKWSELVNAKNPTDVRQLGAIRMRIAFLAGCHRDLRILFGAGKDNRERVALDFDRFEYMHSHFHTLKTSYFQKMAEQKEALGA